MFLKLGFWQLDRKQQKISLIGAEVELRSRESIPVAEITGATESGTPAILKGVFDKEVVLLLDNKVFNGTVGFEVIQLFRDESGLNFLVNRGFTPAGRTRTAEVKVPELNRSTGAFEGYVYKRKKNPYALNQENVTYKFPQIVQREDTVELSSAIGTEVSPFIIRLRDDQVGALPRSWQVSNINPEKHQGYAVQWFLMSFAILIAWLSFTIWFSKDERDN